MTAYPDTRAPLARDTVRRLAAGIIAWTGLATVVTLVIVNLMTAGTVGWAWVPVSAVVGAVVMLCVFILEGFSVRSVAVEIVQLLATLAVIDFAIDGRIEWFIPIALPIVASSALMILVAGLVLPRIPWFAGVSVVLAQAAALSTVIDAAIQRYVGSAEGLGWSAIVLVSAIPLAVLLLSVGRSLRKHTDLRRIFHI